MGATFYNMGMNHRCCDILVDPKSRAAQFNSYELTGKET